MRSLYSQITTLSLFYLCDPRGPESASIEIHPFRLHFINFSKTVSYELNLNTEATCVSRIGRNFDDYPGLHSDEKKLGLKQSLCFWISI